MAASAPRMKESQIQRAILDYLAARGVLAFRMNSGTMISSYGGKTRRVNFGVPGMADVLAFSIVEVRDITRGGIGNVYPEPRVLWIECKAAKGVQSELQKSFQRQVEQHGHRYVIARGIDDVEQALR